MSLYRWKNGRVGWIPEPKDGLAGAGGCLGLALMRAMPVIQRTSGRLLQADEVYVSSKATTPERRGVLLRSVVQNFTPSVSFFFVVFRLLFLSSEWELLQYSVRC